MQTQVLKAEVWFGILGAVFVVAFLIWALDRFSPYSYYNNKNAYPEGARDFTIGESLWFALTSLTPQGGGECPKGRRFREWHSRNLGLAFWYVSAQMPTVVVMSTCYKDSA